MTDDGAIEAAILALVARRGTDKTVCPSEIARQIGGPDDWRRLMPQIRSAATSLVRQGRVAILRKGAPVADLNSFRGVYRIGTFHRDEQRR